MRMMLHVQCAADNSKNQLINFVHCKLMLIFKTKNIVPYSCFKIRIDVNYFKFIIDNIIAIILIYLSRELMNDHT